MAVKVWHTAARDPLAERFDTFLDSVMKEPAAFHRLTEEFMRELIGADRVCLWVPQPGPVDSPVVLVMPTRQTIYVKNGLVRECWATGRPGRNRTAGVGDAICPIHSYQFAMRLTTKGERRAVALIVSSAELSTGQLGLVEGFARRFDMYCDSFFSVPPLLEEGLVAIKAGDFERVPAGFGVVPVNLNGKLVDLVDVLCDLGPTPDRAVAAEAGARWLGRECRVMDGRITFGSLPEDLAWLAGLFVRGVGNP